MSSRDFEAIVCTVAYYFLKGVACEAMPDRLSEYTRHWSPEAVYSIEAKHVVSPMGGLIGYEINGKMMRVKKMKFVPIMEDVNDGWINKSF